MSRLTFEPARPIDTDAMPWIPTESVNADTQRALYLNWCREHAVHPAAQILS
jgi:hypothetical protein